MKLPFLIGFIILSIYSVIPLLEEESQRVEKTLTLSVERDYTHSNIFEDMTDITILEYDDTMIVMTEDGMRFVQAGVTNILASGQIRGQETTMEIVIDVAYEVAFQDGILPSLFFSEETLYELPTLDDFSDFIGWADVNNPNILFESSVYVDRNYEFVPLFRQEQSYNLTAYHNYDLEYVFVGETLDFYVINRFSYLDNEPLFLEFSDETMISKDGFSITFLEEGFLTIDLVNESGEIKDSLQIEVKTANGTIIVSFDTKGGNTIDPIEMASGSRLSVATPTKDGYVFNGWVDESIERAYDMGDFIYESLTLTAQWRSTNNVSDEEG